MMSTIDDDLKSFTQFVQSRMHDAPDLKLPELFDLWMLQNPSDADHDENVAAINASINDFINGDRGTLAGEHSRQLREEFDIRE